MPQPQVEPPTPAEAKVAPPKPSPAQLREQMLKIPADKFKVVMEKQDDRTLRYALNLMQTGLEQQFAQLGNTSQMTQVEIARAMNKFLPKDTPPEFKQKVLFLIAEQRKRANALKQIQEAHSLKAVATPIAPQLKPTEAPPIKDYSPTQVTEALSVLQQTYAAFFTGLGDTSHMALTDIAKAMPKDMPPKDKQQIIALITRQRTLKAEDKTVEEKTRVLEIPKIDESLKAATASTASPTAAKEQIGAANIQETAPAIDKTNCRIIKASIPNKIKSSNFTLSGNREHILTSISDATCNINDQSTLILNDNKDGYVSIDKSTIACSINNSGGTLVLYKDSVGFVQEQKGLIRFDLDVNNNAVLFLNQVADGSRVIASKSSLQDSLIFTTGQQKNIPIVNANYETLDSKKAVFNLSNVPDPLSINDADAKAKGYRIISSNGRTFIVMVGQNHADPSEKAVAVFEKIITEGTNPDKAILMPIAGERIKDMAQLQSKVNTKTGLSGLNLAAVYATLTNPPASETKPVPSPLLTEIHQVLSATDITYIKPQLSNALAEPVLRTSYIAKEIATFIKNGHIPPEKQPEALILYSKLRRLKATPTTIKEVAKLEEFYSALSRLRYQEKHPSPSISDQHDQIQKYFKATISLFNALQPTYFDESTAYADFGDNITPTIEGATVSPLTPDEHQKLRQQLQVADKDLVPAHYETKGTEKILVLDPLIMPFQPLDTNIDDRTGGSSSSLSPVVVLRRIEFHHQPIPNVPRLNHWTFTKKLVLDLKASLVITNCSLSDGLTASNRSNLIVEESTIIRRNDKSANQQLCIEPDSIVELKNCKFVTTPGRYITPIEFVEIFENSTLDFINPDFSQIKDPNTTIAIDKGGKIIIRPGEIKLPDGKSIKLTTQIVIEAKEKDIKYKTFAEFIDAIEAQANVSTPPSLEKPTLLPHREKNVIITPDKPDIKPIQTPQGPRNFVLNKQVGVFEKNLCEDPTAFVVDGSAFASLAMNPYHGICKFQASSSGLVERHASQEPIAVLNKASTHIESLNGPVDLTDESSVYLGNITDTFKRGDNKKPFQALGQNSWFYTNAETAKKLNSKTFFSQGQTEVDDQFPNIVDPQKDRVCILPNLPSLASLAKLKPGEKTPEGYVYLQTPEGRKFLVATGVGRVTNTQDHIAVFEVIDFKIGTQPVETKIVFIDGRSITEKDQLIERIKTKTQIKDATELVTVFNTVKDIQPATLAEKVIGVLQNPYVNKKNVFDYLRKTTDKAEFTRCLLAILTQDPTKLKTLEQQVTQTQQQAELLSLLKFDWATGVDNDVLELMQSQEYVTFLNQALTLDPSKTRDLQLQKAQALLQNNLTKLFVLQSQYQHDFVLKTCQNTNIFTPIFNIDRQAITPDSLWAVINTQAHLVEVLLQMGNADISLAINLVNKYSLQPGLEKFLSHTIKSNTAYAFESELARNSRNLLTAMDNNMGTQPVVSIFRKEQTYANLIKQLDKKEDGMTEDKFAQKVQEYCSTYIQEVHFRINPATGKWEKETAKDTFLEQDPIPVRRYETLFNLSSLTTNQELFTFILDKVIHVKPLKKDEELIVINTPPYNRIKLENIVSEPSISLRVGNHTYVAFDRLSAPLLHMGVSPSSEITIRDSVLENIHMSENNPSRTDSAQSTIYITNTQIQGNVDINGNSTGKEYVRLNVTINGSTAIGNGFTFINGTLCITESALKNIKGNIHLDRAIIRLLSDSGEVILETNNYILAREKEDYRDKSEFRNYSNGQKLLEILKKQQSFQR